MRYQVIYQTICVAGLVAVLAGIIGCGTGDPKTVQSNDGMFQVTVPGNWAKQTDLNEAADIQVANRYAEMYLIVLSEPKSDFPNPTVEVHSELTRGAMMSALSGAKITAGPTEMKVNGFPALQYEIRATADGVDVAYIHTTIATDDHLHQVLAWTLPGRLNRNREKLSGVITSFRPVKQATQSE